MVLISFCVQFIFYILKIFDTLLTNHFSIIYNICKQEVPYGKL